MKMFRIAAVALVLSAGASYIAAGELETVSMKSGVKFNETLVQQSAAGLKNTGDFVASPPAEVSATGKVAQQQPKSEQAQPKAEAVAGKTSKSSAPAARPSVNKHPCYNSQYGYYYDCDDYHHHDHENTAPLTIGGAIVAAAAVGWVVALAFTTPIGIIVGVVLLLSALGTIMATKKKPAK